MFQLPSENNEKLPSGGKEATYGETSNVIDRKVDPRLGLGRAAAELDENVENEVWPESGNRLVRLLEDIGAKIEQERESIRNDFDQAA